MGLSSFMSRIAATLGNDEGGEPVVNQALDIVVPIAKLADDGMASTATADSFFFANPFDVSLIVISANYVATTGGITADAANNATVSLKTNNGAGGATAVALAFTTDLAFGTVAQNQPKAFTTRTPANCTIPPGGGLWLNIAKGGTGVVVRQGFINVRLRKAA